MKYLLTCLLTVVIPSLLAAQEQVEMADTMRSEGKIYVVVAVILVIFFGLVTYLVLLDKKVSKLEKQLKS